MQEVYKAIGRVADQTFPVLITSESGTGKELVARAVRPCSSPSSVIVQEQILHPRYNQHRRNLWK